MREIRSRIFLVILLIVALAADIDAQISDSPIAERYIEYYNKNPREYTFLETDRRIYYSGNNLNFNLAVFDQYLRLSTMSKIGQIDLLHEDGDFNIQYKIRLDSGVGSGSIPIPLDIPTGNYQMVASTHFMKNFPLDNHSAHRIPIYVQNVRDNPGEVVQYLEHQVNDDNVRKDLGVAVSIKQRDANTYIHADFRGKEYQQVYVVSEGLRELQFIAQTKLQKQYLDLMIPSDRLRGSFQKLIFLNEKYEVLGVKPFFIDDNSTSTKPSILGEYQTLQRIVLQRNNNLLPVTSSSLFKRFFRLYYGFPLSINIDEIGYASITEFLDKSSPYSIMDWEKIVSDKENPSPQIKWFPEGNIMISGVVSGSKKSLVGAHLSIMLLNNGIETKMPISETGQFISELPLPINNDEFYYSVLDYFGRDITNDLIVDFDSDTIAFEYLRPSSFLPKRITDSLIQGKNEFNYVLSTFTALPEPETFFWEREPFEFDSKISTSDYSDLASFEEFVREAVPSVFISLDKGRKRFKMVTSREKLFMPAQLVILNDHILNDPRPLFSISLENIESISTAYKEETLKRIGGPFVGGIIAVKTKEVVDVEKAWIDKKRLKPIIGYPPQMSNAVYDRFNQSTIRLRRSKSKKISELESLTGISEVEILDNQGNYFEAKY